MSIQGLDERDGEFGDGGGRVCWYSSDEEIQVLLLDVLDIDVIVAGAPQEDCANGIGLGETVENGCGKGVVDEDTYCYYLFFFFSFFSFFDTIFPSHFCFPDVIILLAGRWVGPVLRLGIPDDADCFGTQREFVVYERDV